MSPWWIPRYDSLDYFSKHWLRYIFFAQEHEFLSTTSASINSNTLLEFLSKIVSDIRSQSMMWSDAARGLIAAPTHSRDVDFQVQVVAGLNDIIRTIDAALETSDLNETVFPLISTLLYQKALVLFTRFTLLGSSGDLNYAIHIHEAIPHFYGTSDAELLGRNSQLLAMLISHRDATFRPQQFIADVDMGSPPAISSQVISKINVFYMASKYLLFNRYFLQCHHPCNPSGPPHTFPNLRSICDSNSRYGPMQYRDS